MAKTEYASVADYIAAQPAAVRPVLASVRAILREALPRAGESISYQIPVYKVDGEIVIYFASFKNHYGLYPMTAHTIAALGKELAGLLHGKATIRFPYEGKVPARLITRIAKLRAAEAAARMKARVMKKAAAKAAKKKAPKPAKKSAREASRKTG